jgi:hypothetical protein
MMGCVLFFYNSMIWWAFLNVIMCYPLRDPYLCGKIFASVVACIILVLQYHIAMFLFSRWWEVARD